MNKQIFIFCFNVLLNFYKIVAGSMLIIYVPADCNDVIIYSIDNQVKTNALFQTTLGMNIATLIIYMCMYKVESIRELTLKSYLEENENVSRDVNAVSKRTSKLPYNAIRLLKRVDRQYAIIFKIALIFNTCNILISGIVIFAYSPSIKLINFATFTTNVICVLEKLYTTNKIIKERKKGKYISAYTMREMEYNDLSKREKTRMMNESIFCYQKTENCKEEINLATYKNMHDILNYYLEEKISIEMEDEMDESESEKKIGYDQVSGEFYLYQEEE